MLLVEIPSISSTRQHGMYKMNLFQQILRLRLIIPAVVKISFRWQVMIRFSVLVITFPYDVIAWQ